MKVEEIRKMSDEELSSELASLKEELFKLRFQHATNQLDNPAQIAQVKRDIARVMTIQREKQLAANK
ncbi:large subunit ribosomal protein L29 [Ruminococcaceae bacterium R-25]|jgi:large subunit ribosomal protein L29|nr:50S ribosomal protein L29 [Clostridiales bacterium]MDY6338251.1 50S ribosomal protein L29 [Saccharofermentans sp.]PWJ68915.1 large subunit ribosomal protein L29 [Ruminococcaceae bacterium R-25]SUQ22490.1 large subunit ribosomal protein L29 [Oscillospiraceae bacterium]MBR2993590.1 50S ribosomal protein L29 [Clostridiales bacterium]